ncbi:MAG: hypothetical protein NZ534_10195, partial [Bacteroidia bacterium]|nr:hypothetical protein [Bacteroidia bacterium]
MGNPLNLCGDALAKDIYEAAKRVGMTNDASVYNRAINAFRPFIREDIRESQSIGIYLRDQLTSYRGDSQAVKILQEGYKLIQEPLVNNVYAVAKDYVENKPTIPILLGNIAMVTAQIPPPAGVVLTAVASTLSIVAELFGKGKAPIPPPTAEDLINRDFITDLVGNRYRFFPPSPTRWIWANEARNNGLVAANLGNEIGKKWAYGWFKLIQSTNFFGATSAPQRLMADGGGEFGLTIGNHTQDIDIYALENKVKNEQPDRYLWWLFYVFSKLDEYWRGRMLGNTNEEKYARTAFFQCQKFYAELINRQIATSSYYQKLVDVMAMLTGKMQAFFIDINGEDVENLNPQGET